MVHGDGDRQLERAKNFLTARVAVLVVHFLEVMKIEDDQAQRMSVAAGAVEFLVKVFAKEAAIVESGERIGDRVAMQILEVLVFKDYRNTKQSGGGKHIDERGLQGDVGLGAFGEINFAGKDFVPESDRFVFWNFNVSDRDEKALEKLRTSARF